MLPPSVELYNSKSGRTYVWSPTSSAVLRPSTVWWQALGDRDGAGASGRPADDRNCADTERGKNMILWITAPSTAQPLPSANPLTGFMKDYTIVSRPKWISAS